MAGADGFGDASPMMPVHSDADLEEDEDQVLDKDRGYTDVPWLFFAIALVIGGIVLTCYALVYEQMDAVNHGMDWRGKRCGVDKLAEYLSLDSVVEHDTACFQS
jgi:hypothetical protein